MTRNSTLRILDCPGVLEEEPEDTFFVVVNALKLQIDQQDVDKTYRASRYNPQKESKDVSCYINI